MTLHAPFLAPRPRALLAGAALLALAACTDGNPAVPPVPAEEDAALAVTVAGNLAPVITLGPAPGRMPEGSLVPQTFTVADADHTTFSYSWTWGDGTTSTGVSTHRYLDNGWYPVRLIVRDPGGRADTARFRQTITNLPPTARFWAPASGAEGTPFVLQLAHPTDPGTADRASLEYSFDCGDDEAWRPYGPESRITCPQNGGRSIHIAYARIRDKDGGVTQYGPRFVRVTDVRPRVEARLADPGAPRGPVAFRFTDGPGDGPWVYRVRRGNGTYSAWMPATLGTWITTPAYAYPSGSHAEAVYVREGNGSIGYSAPVTLVVP